MVESNTFREYVSGSTQKSSIKRAVLTVYSHCFDLGTNYPYYLRELSSAQQAAGEENKKGPKPDAAWADPEVSRKLSDKVERGQIDVLTSFHEVWTNNPESCVVSKEKLRRYFNTLKKTVL